MFFKAWAQPHKEHLTGGTQTIIRSAEFPGLHFRCICLSRSLMRHCHTLVTSTSFSLEASPLCCLLGEPGKRQPYRLLLDRGQSRGPSPGLSSSQLIMWVSAYLNVMIILLMSVASWTRSGQAPWPQTGAKFSSCIFKKLTEIKHIWFLRRHSYMFNLSNQMELTSVGVRCPFFPFVGEICF